MKTIYENEIKAILSGDVTVQDMNELFEKKGIMVDYEDGQPARIYHRQDVIWEKEN